MKNKQQKTILIAIFQGVEAKNILRTSILETLLKDVCVRIVLLCNSQERVDYYKKEFQNDRLIYEVVRTQHTPNIDAFFGKLKFMLLKTDTTDLLRFMLRDSGRNLLVHWIAKITNAFLARSLVRKFVRRVDFLFVREHTYAKYFDTYMPDLVFLAHLFDDKEIHILREAKRRGVKSVGLINSWDQTTSRSMLRLLPDWFVVYNALVKQELIELHDASPERIYVGGIAQYDEYYIHTPKSRDDFFKDIHADPRKKLMVYAPVGKAFSNLEWTMIDVLYGLNASGAFGNNLHILVRFQPNDFVDQKALKLRPHLCYDYPGVRFTKSRSVDWDMNKKEVWHLADTLYHADIVVSYVSSISIDAALFDTPVINIGFTAGQVMLRESPMQYYGMEHYKKAVATGGIRLVSSVSEFCASVKRYLDDPSLDRAGRMRLVETQCVFTDGRSGERIGLFLLGQL
ncbi:MAG: hypothetical protein G01um101448_90 [Parcubacteria group bacterium Gr01-1014_48]|nr:MAG: hypothetical protein Greene041614_11 [Parcubacteria group bacterium Greene0416_14]TSC74449.1 MAG: hypothetical protein G01um101448_90 [Parcubacteria group bacterium Gr01-1014_48]TSD01759.1 MAG: hypothetical protein Greene101415_17 [Parcubacteria group bacterium Greene1014_15]TSD08473.1 MAG: hypothetical protein Greene07144_12 [Parcubacteria group bacterium Greene0714_4]